MDNCYLSRFVTTCDDLVTTIIKGVGSAATRITVDVAAWCDDRADLFPYIHARTHTRAPAHARFFNIRRHSRHKVTIYQINQKLRLCRPIRYRSSQVVTGRHTRCAA